MPPHSSPISSSHLLAAVLLAGPLLGQTFKAQEEPFPPLPEPPGNILLVVMDDVGLDVLSVYGVGSNLPPTPTLDGLAANGVTFWRAYMTPQGSSTMASVETGRIGEQHGIGFTIYQGVGDMPLPLSETILPEMLDGGTGGLYSHAMIGKWFLGNDVSVGDLLAPNVMGYSHYEGTLEQLYIGGYDYFTHPWVTNGTEVISDVYATTQVADSAIAWIASAPEPWFCHMTFNACHTPYHIAPGELHTQNPPPTLPPHGNPHPWYTTMLEAMDTELGRVLGAMDPAVRERTTVIVVADNGTPKHVILPPFIQQHGKLTLFEQGINVPMIVSGHRVEVPGRSVHALVMSTDLFATIAELAGVDLAASFPHLDHHSISFAPHLFTPNAPRARDHVFSEKFYPNGVSLFHTTQEYTVVQSRYKLMRIWNFTLGYKDSMYDLQVDPLEQNDLLATSAGAGGLSAGEKIALLKLRRQMESYLRP